MEFFIQYKYGKYYKNLRLRPVRGINFCDYSGDFYKKLSFDSIFHCGNG